MNFFGHLSLVLRHRREVRKLCFKCGLYYQGLVHDLSKFSFIEFKEGVKYFNGMKSPNSLCRKETGVSLAWLHHKGRNKHHPDYWIDGDNYLVMPYKYAVEGICDKIAASKVYNKGKYTNGMPLEYWKKQKKYGYKVNDKIAKFFDIVLTDLSNEGESYILSSQYMKEKYSSIVES